MNNKDNGKNKSNVWQIEVMNFAWSYPMNNINYKSNQIYNITLNSVK